MVKLHVPRVTTERDYTRTQVEKAPVPTSCDDCRYPERCKDDRLCWADEKAAISAERDAPAQVEWTRELCVEAVTAWVAAKGRPPSRLDWQYPAADHPHVFRVERLCGSWAACLKAAGHLPLGSYGKVRTPK